MALQQKFRGAFNGFHREDVVNYIARLTHEHQTQVNGMKTEMGFLQEELAQEREKNAQLLKQINELLTQAKEKRAQEELELFRQAEKTQREAEQQVSLAYEKAEAVLAASKLRADALAQAVDALRESLEVNLRED